MKRPQIPIDGIVGDAALREASASEFRQVIELVRAAVYKVATTDGMSYVGLVAIYPDRAVIERASRQYAYPWTLGDDNVVTIASPVEVVLDHKPVAAPMREAVDGWFVEAKATEAGKPTRYLVRVIRAGTSLNGVTYSAAVLREAAPLFEGVRVFAKSDDEHIKGGGKDFRLLVGRLVEAKYHGDNGAQEIRAVLEVLESSDVAAKLREAVANGMTDLFGLSIDAAGKSKTTGKFREALSITKVASVDLIIEPGAGGQVIRFAEAHKEQDMLRQQMIDQIRTKNAKRADELAQASDADVLTAYREAFIDTPAQTVDPAAAASAAGAGIGAEELNTAMRMVEARADARVRIASCGLPALAQQRLQTRFAEARAFTLDQVDTAITEEKAYVASFRESAPISGLGLRVEPGEDRSQKVASMLDGFFEGKKEGFRSFREAYVEITGDARVTGRIENCDRQRLREAAGAKFLEAVSASTFNDILGDSITRQMLREYNANPLYQDWRWLCDVVPVNDFRTQERTRMGGYGNLPAVAENAAYGAMTTPLDEKATYAITKRGGTETISLEAISNDDVGAIRRIPVKLGTSASRTLFEFIYAFIDTNALIYDGLALFVAGHNNLGATALSAATFAAARLRMQKQPEADSAKRLGLVAQHVMVPTDMEEAAYDLFVRTTNNDESFVQSRKPTVHVIPHWTDTNNWFVTADKSQVPLIQVGFYGGQEEPELFVQDNPTQGSLFSNDQIKYKIRHIYSGAVMDFRGFDGSIVI